jgi:hypothetical protein
VPGRTTYISAKEACFWESKGAGGAVGGKKGGYAESRVHIVTIIILITTHLNYTTGANDRVSLSQDGSDGRGRS